MAVFQPRFKDPKTGVTRKTRIWWYKFTWRGQAVRGEHETNKQASCGTNASGTESGACKRGGRHQGSQARSHAPRVC